jgi:methylphosphotriester-DNA--protein-cysteine methyltransferase
MTPPSFTTPDARWAALQSRNPLASDAFIYCVTTTKIYCKPNCPSRLARRANIKFHDTAAEAAAAGFRPCKRCRPSLKTCDGDPQVLMAEKACNLIRKERGDSEKWAVKSLAKEVGLTESHFCRVFKKVTGMTVGEYRNHIQEKPVGNFPAPLSTECGMEDQSHSALSSFGQDNLGYGSNYDDIVGSSVLTNPLSSKLAQDWNIFTGSAVPGPFDPGKDLENFDFSNYHLDLPEHPSDFSTPQSSEDCFQFLDFDWPTSMGPQA